MENPQMQDENREDYQVPKSFLFPPFYTKRATFKASSNHYLNFKDILINEPFYFDMLNLLKEELTEIPWENSEQFVPDVIVQWKKLRPQLHAGFTKRKTTEEIERTLIHALSLFIVCLFWANDTAVKSLHVKDMRISSLKIKPINCEERLSFVINKPAQFHSFVQLQQLYDELEKAFHKARVIKRIIK